MAKDHKPPQCYLYCVGNEISEAGLESGAETNRRLCNTFRELDPTRYTTNALNGLDGSRLPSAGDHGDVMRKFPAQPGSNRRRWRRQQCSEQPYEPDVRGKLLLHPSCSPEALSGLRGFLR